MEESLFPRGKATPRPISGLKKQPAKPAAKDSLFSEGNKSSSVKETRKSAKRKYSGQEDGSLTEHGLTNVKEILEDRQDDKVDFFYGKRAQEGMLLLGCVSEIRELELVVSLPHCNTGYVQANQISETYTSQIRRHLDEDGEELVPLSELFHIGDIVVCGVLSQTATKKLQLTVQPSVINKYLSTDDFFVGQIISGSVKSEEDHGYTVDIGKSDVKAFLPLNEAGGRKFPLPLGTVVRATVDSIRGDGFILLLSLDEKKIAKSSLKESQRLSIDALQPGMIGAFKPTKRLKSGLAGKFMGYSASICALDCSMDGVKVEIDDAGGNYGKKGKKSKKVKNEDKNESDETGEKQRNSLRGCVLFINPLTKHIALCANQFVLSPGQRDNILDEYRSRFPHGHKCDVLVSQCLKGLGVLFTFESGDKGFCPINHISDEKFTEFSAVFGNKKNFPARVLQNVTVDGVMVVTLRKSIVESEFYSYENVAPGLKVDCTIQMVQDNGLIVVLGKNLFSPVKGFVPKIHMADVLLQHPEKKFSKGDLITCRILDVDRSAGRIRLTHKRTLLKSKLPVITSYDQLEPDSILHGYIAAIKQYGVFINLFNNVHGLVPRGQLAVELLEHPEKMFFVGQVMKCRVLSCDPVAERARFSFILNPKSKASSASGTDDTKIVSVEIVQKIEEGFNVLVCDDSQPKRFWNRGVLPTMHLSDFPSLAKRWWDLIAPGEILNDCMVVGKRREWHITRKKTILNRSSNIDGACQGLTFSDLQEGLVSRGFIHHIESYGVFVHLPGGLVGLCPKSKMADKFLLTSEGYFREGQSVIAKVVEVDSERKRFIVTLQESECTADGSDLVMQAYLTELNSIMRLLNPSWLETFCVGKAVSTTIAGPKSSSNDYPCINLAFPDEFAATVVDGNALDKGQDLQTTLLCIDAARKKIVLSADPELLKTAIKQGTPCKATVKFLNEDVMSVVALHKNKRVAALSLTRIHPNQPVAEDSLPWKVGDVVDVTIGKPVAENNVAIVNVIAPQHKSTRKRQRQESEGSVTSLEGEVNFGNLQVGQEVEGTIRSVRHNCLLVRFTDSEMEGGYRGNPVTGQLHISEIEDEPKQGLVAMKKLQCWSKIKCKVIGFRDVKTQHFLAITKRNSTRCILELSQRKEPLRLQLQNLAIGQEVTAFSTKYIPEKDQIKVEVTPSVKGFVPLLLLSDDPSSSLRLMHRFKKPVAWHCVVHKLLRGMAVFAGKGAMVDRDSQEDINEIRANCVLNGKVRKIFPCNVVLSLADGGVGKVHVTNSSDDYSENVFENLEIGQIVRCSVLSCTDSKSLALSLRKSDTMPENNAPGIQDRSITNAKDLEPGMVIRGFVKNMSSSGIFITLSPTVTGRVGFVKASKYYMHDTSVVETIFKEGRLVTCKIVAVSQIEGKIDLSLLESDTGVLDLIPEKLGLPLRHGKPHQTKKKEVGLLVDKVEGRKMKKRKLEKKAKEEGEVVKKKMKPMEDKDSGLEDLSLPDSPPGYLKIASQTDLNEEEDPGFDWDTGLTMASNANLDNEDSSDEEEDIDELPKKTKKDEESEQAREEAELRRKEEMLLVDAMPETALDWDKLVLSSPQNSLLWVSYMAFHLHSTEVAKARVVAERAIKTIDFREEKEKWNVWAALLNLENRFGSEDSLTEAIKRACQCNDPLKVNFHMVSTFERAGKFDKAEDLCQKMVRKFKQNKTVWILYIAHLMQQGKVDEANKVFKRSLQSLEKKFHLEVISKFAQLEYKGGDPERGRVLFENALSSYPKRADLWSIYLDMLVKLRKVEDAREVFERVVTLTLSTKKMRSFFKKYIDFETKYGNSDNVAEIKQKALEYIEMKTADVEE